MFLVIFKNFVVTKIFLYFADLSAICRFTYLILLVHNLTIWFVTKYFKIYNFINFLTFNNNLVVYFSTHIWQSLVLQLYYQDMLQSNTWNWNLILAKSEKEDQPWDVSLRHYLFYILLLLFISFPSYNLIHFT